MSSSAARSFVPAAGHAAALPLYDPLLRLFGFDALRALLLEDAGVLAGQHVVDLGCGTGSLAVSLKQLYAQARIEGLDPDASALAVARRKAARAGVSIVLTQGFADGLPWADASVDHVFCSFMFHHLEESEKRATLAEVRRVLTAGGVLHFADFVDQPRAKSRLMRLLHRLGAAHHLPAQSDAALRKMFAEAGLEVQQVRERQLGLFGRAAFYRALR
jgi:ubiquinone/menaquinone biosynthesis C-methylase UbiE